MLSLFKKEGKRPEGSGPNVEGNRYYGKSKSQMLRAERQNVMDLSNIRERKLNEAKVEQERIRASKEEDERKQIMIAELTQEEQRRRGAIMDKTEQGGEVIDFTMGTMGLVDRLEAHPAGKMLKNVVISNEPPPDRELNIHRLRRYKPQNDFAKLTLSDVPEFDLNEEYMEFQLTEAMTEKQLSNLKKYVLVSDVFIHYIPLDSFYSASAPVQFQLNDFRKVDNTTMREYPLTHSGGYNILMTLDYCVAKKDLHHLTLSISTSLSSFRKGASWGSAKVVLTISHMDFPIKANIQETMGVLHLSDSDLTDFVSDPRHSDGVITPEALKLLRGHYKRGEIENINLPRDDTKSINTAKTVVDGDDSSVNVKDLMSRMRSDAMEAPTKQLDRPKPKPAIKQRPMSPMSVDDLPDEEYDGLQNLSDIQVGESNSQSSDTIELERRPSTPPRSMRAVNFG
jgi:hypothetical protein